MVKIAAGPDLSDHPDMVGTMTRDKILEMAHDA